MSADKLPEQGATPGDDELRRQLSEQVRQLAAYNEHKYDPAFERQEIEKERRRREAREWRDKAQRRAAPGAFDGLVSEVLASALGSLLWIAAGIVVLAAIGGALWLWRGPDATDEMSQPIAYRKPKTAPKADPGALRVVAQNEGRKLGASTPAKSKVRLSQVAVSKAAARPATGIGSKTGSGASGGKGQAAKNQRNHGAPVQRAPGIRRPAPAPQGRNVGAAGTAQTGHKPPLHATRLASATAGRDRSTPAAGGHRVRHSPALMNALRKLWNQGKTAKHSGDYVAARRAWQQALRLCPHHPGFESSIQKLPLTR